MRTDRKKIRLMLTWLAVAALMLAALGTVPVSADVINVADGDSIQEAIDGASDGDIIRVGKGTYEELLTIDGKDLKLVAVGEVTISPPEAVEVDDKEATIEILNSKCTIEGFTIDVNDGWEGIYAYGGPYYKTGEVELTAKNNTVKDYERNGITVNGTKASGQITNNTVVGQEDDWWANNGIQIGFGATGFIKGNTIENNIWIGEDWTATAILLYGVSDVQVVNNEVSNGQLGIGVMGDNNAIVNNYLEAGTWGIGVYSGENNKVIRNTIEDYEYNISDGGDESKIQANVLPAE